MRERLIKASKRIVVKVGSNVLSTRDGRINDKIIAELTRQIAELCRGEREVIIVTSGAISTGMSRMKLKGRPRLLPQLQAAAAVGQSHLMRIYASQFRRKGLEVAQILLTVDDLKARHRHLNARNTIISLLDSGVVPIINENDTVVTDEIKFGDNDILSALVVNLVRADLLVLLTDTEGLMTKDPRRARGTLIREVYSIGPEIEALAQGTESARGTGGMASKVQAVKIVVSSGEAAVIADGRAKDVLGKLLRGEEVGTFFHPRRKKLKGKKRWIAFFVKPKGKLIIDDGAAAAIIRRGKSLLATGVKEVRGRFACGDTVSIVTTEDLEVARGLTNYAADELRGIRGLKTSEIRAALGYKDYDEVVHRDNLVLL